MSKENDPETFQKILMHTIQFGHGKQVPNRNRVSRPAPAVLEKAIDI